MVTVLFFWLLIKRVIQKYDNNWASSKDQVSGLVTSPEYVCRFVLNV